MRRFESIIVRSPPQLPMRPPSTAARRSPLQSRIALAAHRLGRLDPTVQGLLWSASAGAVFSVLNALMRGLAMQLDPFQAQFLRYLFGLMVLLPLVWRSGLAAYRPRNVGGQFLRGAFHTLGLMRV
jgi:hypothetical protein